VLLLNLGNVADECDDGVDEGVGNSDQERYGDDYHDDGNVAVMGN